MASILWLPVVFTSCSGLLYWLSMSLPALPTEGISVNSTALRFPSTLEELQALATLLEHYRLHHMTYVLALYSTAYLFKQAFAIPGSIFLNLLGGALFGQWMGFFLTCLLSASGATFCFLLAKVCGRSYIVKYFPDKLQFINSKIEQNADSLFFFLMFLRLFPMTPNWFLNMASPICGVPVHLFFLSVFFGLMPYNFISVQTGCLLSQLTSMDKVFTPWTMLKLLAMATAALVPGLCIKKYQEYRSNKKRQQEAARETAAAAAAAAKSAEKVEVRNTKARKRLAFQARSKSTDEYRGGEVDPEFYNMLVDQHYAVRQKMQQVAEEKLNEGRTDYCDRTAEDEEHIAETIVDEAEMIDDKDIQEGEIVLTETSIPQRTYGVDLDLTSRNSDVEELLQFEPQGVEELKFSAKTDTNTGVEASMDETSRAEHEEMSSSETECQQESKPNGQRVEDVERTSEDEASTARITNGHLEESGKSIRQGTEVVADDDGKDLIDTLLDQETVDDKVEFCEDLPAGDNHVAHEKDGQTVAAASKHNDISTEPEAQKKQGVRTFSAEQEVSTGTSEVRVDEESKSSKEEVADTASAVENDEISVGAEPHEPYKTQSAEQELSAVPSEVVADVEAKSKQEVASATEQNDDISTENVTHEEQAPSAEQELSALQFSEEAAVEESKSKDELADIVSSTEQNDEISTENVTHAEQAPPAEQELSALQLSEEAAVEESKSKDKLADIVSSTAPNDDISTENEPHEEQAPSAEQELSAVQLSEEAAVEESKSKDELADIVSSTEQNDEISTVNVTHKEQAVQAPSGKQELSVEQLCEEAANEVNRTKEEVADIASAQDDVICAANVPHEEKVCEASLAQQDEPSVPSELEVEEKSESKEEIADIAPSEEEDDISSDVLKSQVNKLDEQSDGANKSDNTPEDLSALNVNNVQDVELESKGEKVNGKEGEGNLLENEASGIQVQKDMKSASTKGVEQDSAEGSTGESLPGSAFNKSAPKGADCQDDQGAMHANGAKSPRTKVTGEDLIQDKTEQCASSDVEAKTVISTGTADSSSQ